MAYTAIGQQITKLCNSQSELAQIMELTQQSVSGKLNGRIAVTLRDLEKLANAFQVPVIYFMTTQATPENARMAQRILDGDQDLIRILETMDVMSPHDKAMVQGILYQVEVAAMLRKE